MEQIRIDLVPGGVTPNAHASQYDVGRAIRFLLYNGGNSYTLAGTETITVDVTKPDGSTDTVSVTNTSSNYVDFVTTDGLLDQAGLYPCEISLVNGSDVIGSQNFNLRVEADAYGTGLIVILEAQGSPAFFDTDLADNLVDCKINIGYNAEGYTRATVVNSETSPAIEASPYLFRKAGGDLASIGAQEFDTITGGTVAFNQLVAIPGSSATTTQNSVTMTDNRDGSYSFMGTASADCIFQILNTKTWPTHKFILFGCPPNGSTTKYSLAMRGAGGDKFDTGSGAIWDATGNTYKGIVIYIKSGQNADGLKFVPQFMDLTQMFGATIADYIYSLETGTPGAGVAWLRNLFPAPYYAYNAGELLSVKTSAHVMTGKNQFDKTSGQVVNGYFGGGENITANSTTRTVYVKCKPNTTYTVSKTAGQRFTVAWFEGVPDVGVQTNGNIVNNTASAITITTGATANYLGAYVYNQSFDTGTADEMLASVQIEFGYTDTEFEPYQANTYALDPDLELRGMLKLDSGNHLYYDGDRYECDGHVTRRFGIVDLGSLNWQYIEIPSSGGVYGFYSTSLTTKINSLMICAKYIYRGAYTKVDDYDKSCGYIYNTNILIRDDAYTDAPTFKTAMDGVYLVYELASPTAETADAFTNPQNVDSYGTEEYTDTRTVPMPVGHSTIYGDDITYNIADFGTTVYGGSYDFTTGELISTKNADGTDKGTPDVYSLTPEYMPAREGDNYVMGNTDGDAYVKYIKKAGA